MVVIIARPDNIFQRYIKSRNEFLSIRENAHNVDANICKQFDLKPWQKYSEPIAAPAISAQKQSIEIALACAKHLKPENESSVYTDTLLANMGWSSRDFINYIDDPIQRRDLAYRELKVVLTWLVIPPFTLLALGIALAWAIAGFRFKP